MRMAIRVATVLCLLAAASAFDLNLPSLEASFSLQTDGKKEETSSVSSSSFDSSSSSVSSAPAVNIITYPTQTSSFMSTSSSSVGQDGFQSGGLSNSASVSAGSSSQGASVVDKLVGDLASSLSGGLSASLSSAPAPSSSSFSVNLGSQGSGSSFSSEGSQILSSAPAPTSASFMVGLGAQGGGSSFTSQESHISSSAPAPTSSSFSVELDSQSAAGSSISSHESHMSSIASAPAATSSISVGIGSQGAAGSSFSSQESHMSSIAAAPAATSSSFSAGHESQESSFSSHNAHVSSAVQAPAAAIGSSSLSSMTSISSSSQHASAPAPMVHGSSSHSVSSSSVSGHSGGVAFSAPASTSSVSSQISSTSGHSQFSPAATSEEGSNVSTLTVSQSTSSQKEQIYEPLSQPWVSLLQKRFWWIRSLLQKYLRSDFPWRVFSAHPKLWLSIGGGYLRRSSLNEFPFSANKLVWYHPDFENFVYVFSSDSGEGFWASPPEEAFSSLFTSKEGSYKIEFIPSEVSVAALSNSDWSSSYMNSYSYRPFYIALASPSYAASSGHYGQSSHFQTQDYSAAHSGLRVPYPSSASYLVVSSNDRPSSSLHHSQYFSAPAPQLSSPFSLHSSDIHSAIDSRTQIIPYSPYYSPIRSKYSYLSARPSQFSSSSVLNTSPYSDLKFVYYPTSKYSVHPKEVSDSVFLQYVKGSIPKKYSSAFTTSTVFPYAIPSSSSKHSFIKKPNVITAPLA